MKRTCGVVLAGVHRWGDTGLDSLCPRALLPVAHAPLIGHTFDWFRGAGITDVVLCANSATRAARRVLGNAAEFGVQLYYYEDRTPRGPAGCVRDALLCTAAERLIVIDGAVYPDIDLADVLTAHIAAKSGATVVVSDEGLGAGATTALRPTGVYVLERSAAEQIPEVGYRDIKEELIPRLYETGVPVRTLNAGRALTRVRDAESYMAVNAAALSRLCVGAAPPAGYGRIDGGLVHETARLDCPERTFGPVLVGPRSYVAAGARLVGPCVIGADCVIESGAIVSQSIAWRRCHVGIDAVVDQCILSDDTTVAAGEVLSGLPEPVRTAGERPAPIRAPAQPTRAARNAGALNGAGGGTGVRRRRGLRRSTSRGGR